MTEGEKTRAAGPVIHNLDGVLDAHTHLSGSGSGESAENILECMDACGVEKAFIFAPELDLATRLLTNEHLNDIRTHNDYCADICSKAPERLLGFCTLNPARELAGGDLDRAVDLMIEEAKRCYHELGLRGVGELVPARWYPNEPPLGRLYEALAGLGMYTVFHTGIFFDGRESSYCRPTFYEAVHQALDFKGHFAHLGWPWVDECIAVLKIGNRFLRIDPSQWGFKVDVSFGSPDDWQLETWQRVLDTLPPDMPCYGSDVFWPTSPEEYREKYLQPQLGLFETATTLGHLASEGSVERRRLRDMVFFENAYSHWRETIREPQDPRPAPEPIETPRARSGDVHEVARLH
jgi:predicted TIM-barrel fold metal-dependent hydrolase